MDDDDPICDDTGLCEIDGERFGYCLHCGGEREWNVELGQWVSIPITEG